MSRLYTCFRDLLFLATSFLHAMTIDVTTTWVGDTIKGTTATLQCSWTNGNPTNVLFLPNNDTDTIYFNCVVQTNLPYTCAPGTLANLSRHSTNSLQQDSVSMMISNLQCADDGISYFCLVGGTFQTPTISKAVLAVKVRPTVPTLSNVQTDVQVNSNITATCTAGVGYPNAGQIVWKTYENGRSVDFYPEPIITSVNVTQPGDDRCTVRTQSSVTLKANRLHQNISLACFVINQGSGAPKTCRNPATDLCAQTYPALITYPVSSVSVTREPVFTLYEGTTVTLKCQAEGNPIPTYTWTKVGDENRRLSIVMDGLVSTLTLTSLNKTLDAGDYTCTVSNVVKNVIHTAFGVISLVIYEPTTFAPTTTSKQTSTSTPTRGTEPSGNNNADNKSDGNTVSMIVMGVILSSIIIVQFVVIIFMIRKSQAVCVKKSGERKPHIYDQPNKEYHYDDIDSCYKGVEI